MSSLVFFKVENDENSKKKKIFLIFLKKYKFLRSLRYFENYNFAARVAKKFPNLLELDFLKYIYLICSVVHVFENRKKCCIAPPYCSFPVFRLVGWLRTLGSTRR